MRAHQRPHAAQRRPIRPARAIADALQALDQPLAGADAGWFERIEAQREQRGRCEQQLLVDDTLGAPGIYDRKVTVTRACGASKPPRPARFLYLLARALAPRRVIELGTNVGIFSAYLAAGLVRSGVERVVS